MHRSVEAEFIGRTYDDFLLRPQLGVVPSRRDVSLRTSLSRRISLELPVVSANMDSVTGARMAQALALEGGIGFIHRAMPIAAQAESVARVKRTYGYVVEQPLSLPRGTTVREARAFIARHDTTGILIEEAHGRDPGGIALQPGPTVARGFRGSGRRSIHDSHRAARDRSARHHHRGGRAADVRASHREVAARRYSSQDGKGRLLVGAAIGARGDFLERAAELLRSGADMILIDIAHGHSQVMRGAVEAVRAKLGDVALVCGNVGTAEGAAFLRDLGADAIKVGIGPGRGCRTRLETGAGVPQLQAIREAWCAVGDAVPIIADGGIRDDKDIFLALISGASSVMLGSMLSGTDEAPGSLIEDPSTGEKRRIYRGMTSPQAVFDALYSDEARGDTLALDIPAEGQEIQVPYKGSVLAILHRIRGHLQSAVSYAGEETLATARAKVLPDPLRYLIPLSPAARTESYER